MQGFFLKQSIGTQTNILSKRWIMVYVDMGYIDIHTHIIPGIDDGSKSNKESVEMLRQAYAAGITTLIATPHFSKGFCDYDTEDVRRYCKALEKYAREKVCAEFRVYPGQEIFYNEKSLGMLQSGDVIALADTNYILLEFAPDVTYIVMFQALREIAMTAYFPVLAHVERYRCLREAGRMEELRQLGVMMQMNYAHIGGKWHDATTRWCRQMLKEGLIDLLGTDMHNSTDRGLRMEHALAWMEKHLDEDYITELMWQNAQTIITSVHKEDGNE